MTWILCKMCEEEWEELDMIRTYSGWICKGCYELIKEKEGILKEAEKSLYPN